jgi:ADP-ribose pyrophosphatase YjhB (NUDIX family)
MDDQFALPQLTGTRRGKRFMQVREVLSQTGHNPTMHLIRIAIKAENNSDLATAARIWAEINCYVEAKRKAVDPTEQVERLNQAATVAELQAIREKILEGTVIDLDVVEQPQLEHIPAGQDLI